MKTPPKVSVQKSAGRVVLAYDELIGQRRKSQHSSAARTGRRCRSGNLRRFQSFESMETSFKLLADAQLAADCM
jgi:hypothetical protein